ncbi:MAG: hypothetical protein RJB61_2446, partial [Actinomycetota bacterium]
MFRRTRTDDRGAILPLVVISMVLLLGMGAMVIDIGHIYAERRQLQNGADAAALAIAQSCAIRVGCTPGAYEPMAANLANRAARDGMTTVREICFGGRTTTGLPQCGGGEAGDPRALGWVRVTTRTLTPEGDEVDFLLAPIVTALTGYTVEATAIAGWGIAGAGRVLPYGLHRCEFEQVGGVLTDPSTGDVVLPTGTQYIYPDYDAGTNPNQTDCRTEFLDDGLTSGFFGWLDHPRGDCTITTSVGDWQDVNNGIDNEFRSCVEPVLGSTSLLAIWDYHNDTGGSGGEIQIIALVGFTVTGYQLPRTSPGFEGCPPNPF